MGAPEGLILPDFQVFIKPVGSRCNLSCSYCYYIGKPGAGSSGYIGKPGTGSSGYSKKPGAGSSGYHVMGHDMLERVIKQQIEATKSSTVIFSWHGGEPMLAGIEFYRLAVNLQSKYCPPGKTILNGIQTNGTLINEDWCDLFAEEKFMVGLSMDGPALFHNSYRKSRSGKGSFKKVLEGFDMMVMYGLDPEILCVVNSENVNYPIDIYSFFRHLGITHITFIPLVERLPGDTASPQSVTPRLWGDFLCAIFDEWLANDIGRIRVQIFEEALNTALQEEHTLCIFKKQCGRVPVVEISGDFYSCDHFVSQDYLIGNIHHTAISEMLVNPLQLSFGMNKSERLPGYCLTCEVLNMCNGECPKNRFLVTTDGEKGLNYLCDGYRRFFNHCRPVVEAVGKVRSREVMKKKFEEEV